MPATSAMTEHVMSTPIGCLQLEQAVSMSTKPTNPWAILYFLWRGLRLMQAGDNRFRLHGRRSTTAADRTLAIAIGPR